MSVFVLSVSLSVFFSVRDHIFDLHVLSSIKIVVRVSVLLWRRSDMLRTSGFMDDVIFAHKPRLLDVDAQLNS